MLTMLCKPEHHQIVKRPDSKKMRFAEAMGCLLASCFLQLPRANAVTCLGGPVEPIPAVTLRLEQDRASPALIYKTNVIELYLRQSDILDVLDESEGKYALEPLSRALRELPSFTQDVTVEELLVCLGPVKPDHPQETRSDQWRDYRRGIRELKFNFNLLLAFLLDSGRASARDPDTGAPVLSVLRTKGSDCYGLVVYRTMGGAAFLELLTAIP
jgi:hypothetical protein